MTLPLHTFSPSPIAAEIGPFLLRWYGITLALGTLAGYFILRTLAKRLRWSSDAVLLYFVVTLSMGVVGARLYHVLNEPAYYWQNPAEIVQVWHGGLAIHGGLIGGLLAIWWFSRKWRAPFFGFTDITAPAIAIGQAVGRWGNYFNQELFGKPTNLPWGIPIDPENRPMGYETAAYFHPTFLYESVWIVVYFFILLLIIRKRPPIGVVTFAYLICAALGRFGTELLRIDSTPTFFGIRLPLFVSAVLVVVGIWGLWYRTRRPQAPNPPS